MNANPSNSAAQGDPPYVTLVVVGLLVLLAMTYFMRDRSAGPASRAPGGSDPYSDSQYPVTEEDWIELKPKLEGNARTAWHPRYGTGLANIGASKVGGWPDLPSNDEWPGCENCGDPMAFLGQLNSNSLPSEAGRPFGSGLLQAYHCLKNEAEDMCLVDGRHLVQVVALDRLSSVENQAVQHFPEVPIEGGTDHREYSFAGKSFSEMFHMFAIDEDTGEISRRTGKDRATFIKFGRPSAQDKLMGWGYWIQQAPLPRCRTCRERKQHIFQFAPN